MTDEKIHTIQVTKTIRWQNVSEKTKDEIALMVHEHKIHRLDFFAVVLGKEFGDEEKKAYSEHVASYGTKLPLVFVIDMSKPPSGLGESTNNHFGEVFDERGEHTCYCCNKKRLSGVLDVYEKLKGNKAIASIGIRLIWNLMESKDAAGEE